MRTYLLAASLGLITVAIGATAAPNAAAADAGEAIETVQSHCSPVAEPALAGERQRDCVAIYRNKSDRPVFDIRSDVFVGGRQAIVMWDRGEINDGVQTRRALAPSESALLLAMVFVPEGIASDAPVTFHYRADWTGDEGDLNVPKPELQYVDRVEQDDGYVTFVGEVRNVDGRTWLPWGDDLGVFRTPIIALFHRGKLLGAHGPGWREPSERIDPDGRYIFVANEVNQGLAVDADAVQVFFRDAFVDDTSMFTEAHWQLTGLDHTVETDPRGEQRMVFRVSARNPTGLLSHGRIGVVVRRADFHAIGYGRCRGSHDALPNAEVSCSGEIGLIRPDASFDDVRFVTVELGGAVAVLPTPTPSPTATPCPPLAMPAPVPTLAVVAGRVWFPWSIRTMPERCP